MRALFYALLFFAVMTRALVAATHEISVEAVCFPISSDHPPVSYRIAVPADAGEREALHPDAVRHIRTALSGRGLFEAPAGVAPDLIITIACELGGRRCKIRTRTAPAFSDPTSNSSLGAFPVAYTTILDRVYVSPKYLMLSAQTAKSSQVVWRVRASLSDETPALEPVLPVLAAAVMNVLGCDTQGTITLRLSSKDVDILFIQAGTKVAGR